MYRRFLPATLPTSEAGSRAASLRTPCAFKVGVNTVRSRGDREEVFGGIGQSWKGCFVGGKYLVLAVTQGGPDEKLYGNFPTYSRLPDETQLKPSA